MTNKVIEKIILNALKEDNYKRDITSDILLPAGHVSEGAIIAREAGILCGLDIARKVFRKVNARIRLFSSFKDGLSFKKNDVIGRLRGPTRGILTAERTSLNFLGHLSGISTNTRRYVDQCRATRAKILDTRKTTPTLRVLEKYAVRCGGGINHRFDLNGMILIKDNHRHSTTNSLSLRDAVRKCRRKTAKKVEIEVDNLLQLRQALEGSPDMILLDNMNLSHLRKAVKLVKGLPVKKRPLLEASGGITLKNVRAVAETGVESISIGALTHSVKSINFSLELKSKT